MRRNPNKTHYHYCVEVFDDNNLHIIERKFYMTASQIMNEYGCSQKSLFNHIKEYNNKSKKLGHIKIHRILEKVYILAPNPNLNNFKQQMQIKA